MADNTTDGQFKNKKTASWHKALFWVELLFTLTIAWVAFILPEIQLAVADNYDAKELLDWKQASIFRSFAIALIYVMFLIAFNWAYVFMLKPSKTVFRLFMIWFPLASLILVFLGGWVGITLMVP